MSLSSSPEALAQRQLRALREIWGEKRVPLPKGDWQAEVLEGDPESAAKHLGLSLWLLLMCRSSSWGDIRMQSRGKTIAAGICRLLLCDRHRV